MDHLVKILGSSRKNFIVIAHRARSDGEIFLNDLCGASGRWDGIARCITGALHLSHDMRRDTSVHLLLLGPEDPPKVLSINGKDVKYLNPDERAATALMKKCLKAPLGRENYSFVKPSPGITITRAGLRELLSCVTGPLISLDEGGKEPGKILSILIDRGIISYILSDDMDLSGEEKELIDARADHSISLGPMVLHSNMAMIITHNMMDLLEVQHSDNA